MSNIYQVVAVHDNQNDTYTKIKVSQEIEVIVSMEMQTATLFYNDVDLEFRFNAKTGSIVNRMLESDPGTQIHLMQVLKQFEIKPMLLEA